MKPNRSKYAPRQGTPLIRAEHPQTGLTTVAAGHLDALRITPGNEITAEWATCLLCTWVAVRLGLFRLKYIHAGCALHNAAPRLS